MTQEKAVFYVSVILSQQTRWGWSDTVTPPQLQLACDCWKCQTECAIWDASEQQLGQGIDKHKVTWPAGLCLQSRGRCWVTVQSGNTESPQVVPKTRSEGCWGQKYARKNKPTNLALAGEWTDKSKPDLCLT